MLIFLNKDRKLLYDDINRRTMATSDNDKNRHNRIYKRTMRKNINITTSKIQS